MHNAQKTGLKNAKVWYCKADIDMLIYSCPKDKATKRKGKTKQHEKQNDSS